VILNCNITSLLGYLAHSVCIAKTYVLLPTACNKIQSFFMQWFSGIFKVPM